MRTKSDRRIETVTSGESAGGSGSPGPVRGVISFLLSLFLHILVLLALVGLYQWTSKPGSRLGSRDTDSVGIVFSTPKGYEKPGGTAQSQVASSESLVESRSTDTLSKLADSFLPSNNRIGMGEQSEQKGDANSGAGASSQGSPGTGSGNGGDGQEVGFSDLRGNGRRFIYVLDRSESMKWSDARPMRYALKETKASIASLDPRKGAARFQLVYYNHDADAFENGRLLQVTEPNKQKVMRFLDSLYPDGGTDPLAAIEKAISMKPDVIFFLTDADEEIPQFNLDRIRALRLHSGVRQIHVVEFGKKTDVQKRSFRQLASENNGQYIFKDITELN